MAWELMNEGNASPESLRLEWTAEMSAYVKSLDSNHLVSSGNANAVGEPRVGPSLGSSEQLGDYGILRSLIRGDARMYQLSFASLDYAAKKKRMKRDVFLAEMAAVVPWVALEALIEPHYPGLSGGRQPFPLA
jgi:hypothetical protein